MAITHLIVDNGNYSVTVANKVVYKLYDLVKQFYANVPNHTPADCYLKGTISVEHAHPSRVTFLEEEFEDLHITMTGDPYIENEDSATIDRLARLGDGAGLTIAAAAGIANFPSDFTFSSQTLLDASFFQYFTGLTSNIPSGLFGSCRSLITIVLPQNMTELGRNMFIDCRALTSITLPNTLTSIGSNAFSGCLALTSITLPGSLTNIENRTFYHCSALTSIDIPDSVTSIGESAFENCTNLASLTIGDSVISISYRAFYACSSLADITFSNSIEEVFNDAFSGTPWLDSQPAGLVYIGKAAYKYKTGGSDTEIVINDGTISISPYCFYDSRSITSVNIPNSVTSIGSYAFSNTNITSINIPDSVTSIGRNAFSNVPLTSVIIPSSIKIIKEATFGACSQLTSVTIPNSITEILQSAFVTCNRLTSVIIPDSVKSIGADAFRYCSRLTDVTIGASVTSISPGAFRDCPALVRVTAKMRTPPSISSTVFPVENNKISLYVPYGCAAAYQAANVWSGFKEIIELPEE